MSDQRRHLGQRGEEIAVQQLERAGLTIRERNWRCARGELDIVALEVAPDYASGDMAAQWLVFVEVRTRAGSQFGTALQAFTPQKRRKLQEVAAHYRQSVGWNGPWRIDAVAVQIDTTGQIMAVNHIRHAILG